MNHKTSISDESYGHLYYSVLESSKSYNITRYLMYQVDTINCIVDYHY